MPQVRNNRNFGWHAGTVTAWDMILNNDFYIYGDLHFGDVSTDTLTINGNLICLSDVAMTFAAGEELTITKTGTGYAITSTGHILLTSARIDVTTGYESYFEVTGVLDATGSAGGVKTRGIDIDLSRTVAVVNGDSRDQALKISIENEATGHTAGFFPRAIDAQAKSDAAGGTMSALYGANITCYNKNGTVLDAYALRLGMKNDGVITTNLYGLYVYDESQGTNNGVHYGAYITTANYNPGGGRDAAIYVDSQNTTGWTTGIDLNGVMATGLDIAGTCTTAAIAAGVAATGRGITVDAGTINHAADGSIISVDLDVEGAYSVNAFNTTIDFETTGMGAADVTTGFKADINELLVHTDGAGLYGTDVTLTGFATGRCDLIGHLVTLDGSKTGGDTSAGFKVISTQTINDSGEDLYGSWVDFSGITHTDGNVYGQYLDVSFTNGSTAYGLYVAMGGGVGSDAGISINGLTDSGLIINAVCTTAINVSAVQTDETGLDASAVFQHGSYSTALAYGTQTAHLVLKSTHITAGATAVYVFGDVNRITTSAASTGYMNPSYAYLSVGHNLVNGWAKRGRVDITETCEVGEMAGLLGTLDVAASKTITVTGGAVLAAAILDLTINTGASVEQEVTCLEVRPHINASIAGSSAGIRVNVNCSSANYLDYGIDIRSMSSQQTAALRILATPATDALATGILLEGQDSSTSVITSAFEINGGNTYLLKFGDEDGSQAIVTDTGTPGAAATHKIKCIAGTSTFYLAGYADF